MSEGELISVTNHQSRTHSLQGWIWYVLNNLDCESHEKTAWRWHKA